MCVSTYLCEWLKWYIVEPLQSMEVSILVRCPYFRGSSHARKQSWGKERVSLLKKGPHFRGVLSTCSSLCSGDERSRARVLRNHVVRRLGVTGTWTVHHEIWVQLYLREGGGGRKRSRKCV